MTSPARDIIAIQILPIVVSHTLLTPHNLTNTPPTDIFMETPGLAAHLHGSAGLISTVNMEPVMLAHPHPVHSTDIPVIADIALRRHPPIPIVHQGITPPPHDMYTSLSLTEGKPLSRHIGETSRSCHWGPNASFIPNNGPL